MASTDTPLPQDPPGRLALRRRRFASLRAMTALMLREMTTTYGRSPGGYLWAVIEPVAGIALLTLIFSMGFRSPPLGTSFPIFYATGIVPFLLYMDVSAKLGQALLFSRALLAYPTVTYADAILARFVLNLLTQCLVAYVVFTAILLMFETRTIIDFARLAYGFALAGALAFGVGVLNCYLMAAYPVWVRVWAIANRPLFLISAIFFTFESVPEPYRSYLWWNPLVHVVGAVRSAFYPYYDADYVSGTYVIGLGLVCAAAGFLLLRRYYRDILQA